MAPQITDLPQAPSDAPGRCMEVRGEIKTIACREGSSGIFTGDIKGLYQGYRFASTRADEREYVLEAPHGTIALRLRQQIVTPLPPRSPEHPFRDGRDPFAERPAVPARHGPGGVPPRAHTGPPGPPRPDAPGMENGKPIFKRVHYMETTLRVLPERSTGIFAGATGETEFVAPNYRMGGHLVVETQDGDLYLTFLEKGSRDTLNADLRVDGEHSTGIYAGATGELQFALQVTPPFYGRGPYSGTIRLATGAKA